MERHHILNSAREEHKGHVTEQLHVLFQDGTFCDVTLTADDYSVHAHKLVLAANSDYFRIMFSGNWSEKEDTNIVLHGLTASGLRAIIEFCYQGIITVNHEDHIVDILSAIKHCQIVKAFTLFEEFLGTTIIEANFSNLMEFSEIYLLETLRKHLIRFAARVFLPSLDQSVFDQLLAFDYDLFVKILHQHTWEPGECGLGPIALFDVVTKWVQHKKERQQYHTGLFSLVDQYLDETMSGLDKVRQFCEMTVAQRRKAANSGGLYFLSTAMCSDVIVAHSYDSEKSKKVSPACVFEMAPLLHAGKAVLNNQIYVFGGSVRSDVVITDKCRRYDPCRDRWLSIRSMSAPRRGFPVVEFEGKLMVLGGIDENKKVLNAVDVYDPYFNTWSKTSFPLPLCIHSHAAAVHSGRVYVSGGCARLSGSCSKRFFCLDPVELSWVEKEETNVGRCGHTLIGHKGRLYQLGGSDINNVGVGSWIELNETPLQIEYFDLAEGGPWTELEWTNSGPFAVPDIRGAYVLDDLLLMAVVVSADDMDDDEYHKQLRMIAYDPETREINQLLKTQIGCGEHFETFNQLVHLKIPRIVWRNYQNFYCFHD